MQHEKSVISQIGCEDLGHQLLTDVFKLNPDLINRYEHPLVDDKRPASVIFVDADDLMALLEWQKFQTKNKSAVAIMVTRAAHKVDGFITLKRPVMFKNVLRALIATHSVTFRTKTG